MLKNYSLKRFSPNAIGYEMITLCISVLKYTLKLNYCTISLRQLLSLWKPFYKNGIKICYFLFKIQYTVKIQ